MSVSDVFLLIVRWIHLVSAAAWVGGSIFYLVVLRPAQRRSVEGNTKSVRSVFASAAIEFKGLVDTCIFVLLVTGVILTANRLTPEAVGIAYVAVLGVKIALSIWMFTLARGRRRRTAIMDAYEESTQRPESGLGRLVYAVSGYNSLVILGIIVFLVSDLLKVLFEIAIAG
jgi:uncharacterized membrane protein